LPPGGAGLFERTEQVGRGRRIGRARALHGQVERLGFESGRYALLGQERADLADRGGVRLRRPAAVAGGQDRRRAVPPGGPAHRRPSRPAAAYPHRDPRPLHGRRQERYVVDDNVVAAEGDRLS
jgi:hypothetical protein